MQDSIPTTHPEIFYKPSEVLNIIRNFISPKSINTKVTCLHGVYWKSDKTYKNIAYDKLKDENSVEEITIITPLSLRDNLKNGNLIYIYGTLDYKLNTNGSILVQLKASRVDKIKEAIISEDEIKRIEYRRLKQEKGYKNVDEILENKLFIGNRPQVALIYANTSITDSDFEKGLVAAKSHIDFKEHRINFANSTNLCNILNQLDVKDFDIIAIVRGGGSGLEKLDDPIIVKTLTNLETAWIYGVGHEKENLFIRNIADKVIPIPFALGTYFRDSVESVIQKKNNSRAILVKEIQEQYQKQIDDSNKKNKELVKQLESFQKQNKEQIDTATKANKNLQEQLTKQTKTLTDIQSQQKKQQEESDKHLSEMLKTNNKLQEALDKIKIQKTEETKQAAEELQKAKERAKELEALLKERKKGCATPGCLGFFAIIIALVTSYIFI